MPKHLFKNPGDAEAAAGLELPPGMPEISPALVNRNGYLPLGVAGLGRLTCTPCPKIGRHQTHGRNSVIS